MAGIKHTKVSALPDGLVPAQVQPSDWNATHDLSGLTVADLPAAVAKPGLDVLPVTGNGGLLWASLYPGLMREVVAGQTLAFVNGTPRAIRIYVPRRTVLTAMTQVGTLGAAHKMHAGLFAVSASTGLLGTLVQDLGEIDASTTGKKVYPNTASVEPGFYWLYYNSNGTTAVIRGIAHSNGAASDVPMATPIVTEAWLGGTAQGAFRLEGTVAYTTAVPATPTMARPATTPTGAVMPVVFQGT